MTLGGTASAGTRASSFAERRRRNISLTAHTAEREERFSKRSRGAMKRKRKSASRAPIERSRRPASGVPPGFSVFISKNRVTLSRGRRRRACCGASSSPSTATAARGHCKGRSRCAANANASCTAARSVTLQRYDDACRRLREQSARRGVDKQSSGKDHAGDGCR